MDDFEIQLENKLEVNRVFSTYMRSNIFFTRNRCKLKNTLKVSKIFPIYLKNPNEFELEYIKDKYFDRLYSIVLVFPSLEYLLNITIFDIDKKYCAFSDDILYIKYLYDKYLELKDSSVMEKVIEENNKKAFCLYISSFVTEDMLIVEVKEWD